MNNQINVNVEKISRLLDGRPSLVDRILYHLFLRNLPKVSRSNWWHYGANNDWYEIVRRLSEVFSREEVVWVVQNVQNQRFVPVNPLTPLTVRDVSEIWKALQKEEQESSFFSRVGRAFLKPFEYLVTCARNENWMPIVVVLFLLIVLQMYGVWPMLGGMVKGIVGGSVGAIQGAQSLIAPQKESSWSQRGGLSAALAITGAPQEQQKSQAAQTAEQATVESLPTTAPSPTSIPITPTPSITEAQVLQAAQEIFGAARGGSRKDDTCWVSTGASECAQGYFQVFILGVQDQAREKSLISIDDITNRLQERLKYAQERLALIERARKEPGLSGVAVWNEQHVQFADTVVELMQECFDVWIAYAAGNTIDALTKTKTTEDLLKKLEPAYCQNLMVEAGVDCKADKPLTAASLATPTLTPVAGGS